MANEDSQLQATNLRGKLQALPETKGRLAKDSEGSQWQVLNLLELAKASSRCHILTSLTLVQESEATFTGSPGGMSNGVRIFIGRMRPSPRFNDLEMLER
jgi:hypothetical protein